MPSGLEPTVQRTAGAAVAETVFAVDLVDARSSRQAEIGQIAQVDAQFALLSLLLR